MIWMLVLGESRGTTTWGTGRGGAGTRTKARRRGGRTTRGCATQRWRRKGQRYFITEIIYISHESDIYDKCSQIKTLLSSKINKYVDIWAILWPEPPVGRAHLWEAHHEQTPEQVCQRQGVPQVRERPSNMFIVIDFKMWEHLYNQPFSPLLPSEVNLTVTCNRSVCSMPTDRHGFIGFVSLVGLMRSWTTTPATRVEEEEVEELHLSSR